MGFRKRILQLQRFLGSRLGSVQGDTWRKRALADTLPSIGIGQSGVSRRKGGIELNRTLEFGQRLFDVLVGRITQEVAASEVRLMRLGIYWMGARQQRLLLRRQLDIDLMRDRRGQLVLQRQDIARGA